MSFGLSIESLDQRILLDESHPGMFFKGKYTTNSTNGLKTVTITDCNTMPIVFAKNLGSGIKISTPQITYNGGTSWTIGAFAIIEGNEPQQPYAGSVELYVFDILGSSDTVNSGYGMNVYDGSGQAIFTTNKKLLKISGYHTTQQVFTSGGSSNQVAIQTITSGTIPITCAICCSAIGSSLVPGPGSSFFFTHGVRRYDSSSIKIGTCGYLGSSGPNVAGVENRLSGNQHLMFIDHQLYD